MLASDATKLNAYAYRTCGSLADQHSHSPIFQHPTASPIVGWSLKKFDLSQARIFPFDICKHISRVRPVSKGSEVSPSVSMSGMTSTCLGSYLGLQNGGVWCVNRSEGYACLQEILKHWTRKCVGHAVLLQINTLTPMYCSTPRYHQLWEDHCISLTSLRLGFSLLIYVNIFLGYALFRRDPKYPLALACRAWRQPAY
jgi:hypothetical protein